jgi:hypothetical protein
LTSSLTFIFMRSRQARASSFESWPPTIKSSIFTYRRKILTLSLKATPVPESIIVNKQKMLTDTYRYRWFYSYLLTWYKRKEIIPDPWGLRKRPGSPGLGIRNTAFRIVVLKPPRMISDLTCRRVPKFG